MTYKLKVSSQNQVTLPRKLVDSLGIMPGMYLYVNQDHGEYTIQNTRAEVEKIYGFLGKKVNSKKMLKSGDDFEKALENAKMKSIKKS
jgi:bifunctional DNA-binding transcriptional regulator/antitoxin component of YhaV-PrlF toxin-antitoxin module